MDFQVVANKIKNVSSGIRSLMFSADISEKVWRVIELNNIEDEEIAIKNVDEVGYVILGLKPRNLFYDAVNKLGIDEQKSKKIGREIEESVFVELDKIEIPKSIAPLAVEQPKKEPIKVEP